jgi:hypothetical protein
VFGEFRNGDGLISSLNLATKLLALFSRSGRKFEIIYCSTADMALAADGDLLGYDVAATGGEFWSIVRDFPSAEVMKAYRSILNANGLFDQATKAEAFLSVYRNGQLADWDMPFEILSVYLGKNGLA